MLLVIWLIVRLVRCMLLVGCSVGCLVDCFHLSESGGGRRAGVAGKSDRRSDPCLER